MNKFANATIILALLGVTASGLTPTSQQVNNNFHSRVSTDSNPRTSTTLSASSSSRREWMKTTAKSIVAVPSLFALLSDPSRVNAGTDDAATIAATSIAMKTFVDPQDLFSLRVPSDFFTLRRTVKGDLPDAKTGKGRRGSSIFTGGNMAKAEVVAVER